MGADTRPPTLRPLMAYESILKDKERGLTRSLFLVGDGLAIDPSDEHGRRLEGHDPARVIGASTPVLGIAPDPPAL